jgi:hypothetical protein
MTAHVLRAMPLGELVAPKIQTLESKLRLDLSAARAHDAALAILGAYKLTGNFHVNLEIVLKDLGVLDQVRHEIEPETSLPFHSDCRHVVFQPGAGVHANRFAEITRSITGRIGFDARHPWWRRLFH